MHKLKVDENIFKSEHMEWTDFLHAGSNPGKLNVISMIFEFMEWAAMQYFLGILTSCSVFVTFKPQCTAAVLVLSCIQIIIKNDYNDVVLDKYRKMFYCTSSHGQNGLLN